MHQLRKTVDYKVLEKTRIPEELEALTINKN